MKKQNKKEPAAFETTDVDVQDVPELSATALIAAGEINKHNTKKTNKKQADLDENAADEEDNEAESS